VFLYKVEAKVATNPKMGLGLFAKEFISKDSVVWEFVDGLDIKISMNKFNALNNAQKEYFIKYGWIQKGEENFYYSSGDLSNFMNHSYNPNINGKEEVSVALRDIHIDEELFINYKDFCFNFDETEVQE
jgi:SET domain-containing protein